MPAAISVPSCGWKAQIRRRDRIASLYVFIGQKEVWGKGFGTEAIVALLDYAFARLDLHQVELWGLEGNERAFRAYEALRQALADLEEGAR